MGQLILQGIPPYKIAYNMKFPGTYFMYALVMSIFGQSAIGIHIGLLLINITSILILYLLVKKLISSYAALAASASFALLSLSTHVYGFAAHATNFVVLAALLGTLLLYKAVSENKFKYYLLSGIFLGLSPVMKQQGLFFPLFGIVYLITSYILNARKGIRSLFKIMSYLVLGILIPFLIMVVVLNLYGVYGRFWYWTIEYATAYASQVTLAKALTYLLSTSVPLFLGYPLFWILSFAGIAVVRIYSKTRINDNYLFILLFAIFSLLSICPGLIFREHYYITLLPAAAILFSITLEYIRNKIKIVDKPELFKIISYGLLILTLLTGIYSQREYMFQLSPDEITSKIYRQNPFKESVIIADYIASNSQFNDQIAVLGSEPEIFFYSNRHSATGYIYTYSLMEIQRNSLAMQKEMISEISSSMPKYFVNINIPLSWVRYDNSESYIFEWIDPFVKNNNYSLVGIFDYLDDKPIVKWGTEAANYGGPKSENFIEVYKKN